MAKADKAKPGKTHKAKGKKGPIGTRPARNPRSDPANNSSQGDHQSSVDQPAPGTPKSGVSPPSELSDIGSDFDEEDFESIVTAEGKTMDHFNAMDVADPTNQDHNQAVAAFPPLQPQVAVPTVNNNTCNQVQSVPNNSYVSHPQAAANSLQTIQSTVSTLRDGLDLMKAIANDYRVSLETAPPAEKRAGLHTLMTCESCVNMNRAMFNTTEILKNLTMNPIQVFAQPAPISPSSSQSFASIASSQPSSNSSSSQPSTSASRLGGFSRTRFVKAPPVYTPYSEQIYEVRMIKMDGVTPDGLDPKEIFMDATNGVPMSVTNYDVRDGSGYFKVASAEFASSALDALVAYEVNNVKLPTIYSISTNIVSQASIKVVKMSPKEILENVPWVNDRFEVDEEKAKRTLYMRNAIWFKSQADVVMITISKLFNGSRIITVHVSLRSFDSMLVAGIRKFKIDLGGHSTLAYVNINPTACFRCMEFGHFFPTCKKQQKCRYCGDSHPQQIQCPLSSSPKCFRCIEHNSKFPFEQRATGHHALSHDCPAVAEQEDLVWSQKRGQAVMRLNNE